MGKEFNDSNISESVRDDELRDRVVYLHRREDDGIPFYVGIGNVDRPYVVHGRNFYWTNVYNKHGLIVEILHENLTWYEACEHEIRLIKEYRDRYPEYLVNLTDGGEGVLGLTGEDSGAFKGHILFLSTCGEYYFICSGRKELEAAGFHPGHVSATILEPNNREYVTSRKIHIDGKKIRFKPIRFNDESEIDDSMLENRVEAVVSNDEIGGKAGENCYNFKGYSLGVSQTQYVLLVGKQDMKSKGFNPAHISYCISGKRQSHKGFIWSRIDKNFDRSNLQTLRDLIPFDEDSSDRLEELLNK